MVMTALLFCFLEVARNELYSPLHCLQMLCSEGTYLSVKLQLALKSNRDLSRFLTVTHFQMMMMTMNVASVNLR